MHPKHLNLIFNNNFFQTLYFFSKKCISPSNSKHPIQLIPEGSTPNQVIHSSLIKNWTMFPNFRKRSSTSNREWSTFRGKITRGPRLTSHESPVTWRTSSPALTATSIPLIKSHSNFPSSNLSVRMRWPSSSQKWDCNLSSI